MRPADPATAPAVESFLEAVLDRVARRVAVVKPQIAFFEQLGSAGIAVLERVCARAREAGCAVLLDAKRGDIGSTAAGYARAYLAPEAPLSVDGLTVNPYLGLDSLDPFLDAAEAAHRGIFVLVKTSNPGSGLLQDREVAGGPLYEHLARALAPACERLVGPATGWSSLGVVVGAPYPEPALRVREILPRALFLVPGFGAQGAGAEDAVRAFAPGPSGLEGGLVNSSRGILFPPAGAGADASGWERAMDEALAAAVDALAKVVQRAAGA